MGADNLPTHIGGAAGACQFLHGMSASRHQLDIGWGDGYIVSRRNDNRLRGYAFP